MIKDDLEIPKQQKWFLKTHQIRADIKRLK
jgi:hypothetical protein